MEPIILEPRYSTNDVPGRCLKCLAEEKLFGCMGQLLRGEGDSREIQKRYELLIDFLQSAASEKLRDDAERYLADGKEVRVNISFKSGKPDYELIVK